MDTLLFIAFVTTTLLFIAVPGPSVAFASAQAVRHGAKAAAITVAGDSLGTVVHISIAVWGLATLIAISETVLPFLQIAGGVFIIYMSAQSFRTSRHSAAAPTAVSHRVTFWAGFFACVTNPKAIVFFVALFPSFISPEHNVLIQSLVYGAIFLVFDAVSILGYALLAMHAMRKATSGWLNVGALSGLGLFGVAAGTLTWSTASVLGLAAVIASYGQLLFYIKLAGGAYLFYLAYKSIRSALSPVDLDTPKASDQRTSLKALAIRGYLLNMTNPKAAFGWIAIVSLGMDTSSPAWVLAAIIAGTSTLSLMVHMTYALAFSTQRMVTAYQNARRPIQGALGGLFAYAGYRLLFSKVA